MHFRLSPNSFEIRLHDSTPRQKHQAKDRVRGSGHRKLALSQPACYVRLGRKQTPDARCLADCKGLWSKRKSAGSQRTRQWELCIDQRFEFLPCCDSLLYKHCGYRGQVALEIGCADVMSRRHALYGMAKLIHVVDVALNGECVQRSNERPPILIVGSRRILHSTKALLAA